MMKKDKTSRYKHNVSGNHGDACVSRKLNDVRNTSRELQTGCVCGYEELSPWWFHYAVVIVTAAFRVYYVCQPRSWWILHPDEIYQSLEVAFGEVYGYGFRPYEYLPPPQDDVTIPVDVQERSQGMYSLRSYLYPRVFSHVFRLAAIFNLDSNPFLLGRIVNAVWTSLLPFFIYHVTRKLFGCHLCASLTCALIASSLHLSVFGTHTIVNSFLATPFFFGFMLCLRGNQGDAASQERCIGLQSDQNSNILNKSAPKKTGVCRRGPPISKTKLSNICSENEYLQKDSRDIVLFSIGSKDGGSRKDVRPETLTGKSEWKPARVYIANMQFCLEWKKTHFTLHQLRAGFKSLLQTIIGGVIIGVTCYIRVDQALFFLVVYCSLWFSMDSDRKQKVAFSLIMAVGILLGILIGGLDDYLVYGEWILTPRQWMNFNLMSGLSSILFGSGGISVYLATLWPDTWENILQISSFLVIVYSFICRPRTLLTRNSVALLVSYVVLFCVYSGVGHKESRFIHNCVVLKYVVISSAVHVAVKELKGYISKSKLVNILLVGLLISVANTYQRFPSPEDGSDSDWAYTSVQESSDVNVCLNFIGRHSNDVTGLFLDAGIYSTGGYTIINHDVPLLAKVHYEFHLYRGRTTDRLGQETNLRLFNRYSDFIHIKNIHYLAKTLTETNEFNYVVTRSTQVATFTAFMYHEVFRSGNFTVMKRTLSEVDETKLNRNAKQLPVGVNASVLEYESSWLTTAGLFEKAAIRLNRALVLSQDRIRVFQLLSHCYYQLGRKTLAKQTQKLCVKIHGPHACARDQDRLVLHPEYQKY